MPAGKTQLSGGYFMYMNNLFNGIILNMKVTVVSVKENRMIYSDMTRLALEKAWKAHEGQKDKAGMPYILHPVHVAEQMKDEIAVCAALLHDIVEDTDVTSEELERDFPEEVTDAVKILTREKNTDYMEYISIVSSNPVAREVKLADLAHNSDPDRMAMCSGISEKKKKELLDRYSAAEQYLREFRQVR